MSLDRTRFLDMLQQLELIPAAELQRLQDELGGWPDSSEHLAGELIARELLTKFQAAMILRGTGASLQIRNYLIEEPLGQGGIGRIYRARHTLLERAVAVKVLHRKIRDKPEYLEQFLREVRVIGQLHHPNIVTAFDADERGGTPYLVMEFVDGADLQTIVDRSGPLRIAQVLDVMRQAAAGLAYAHARAVVHRDVKPANLLLSRSGELKILDLGLARWLTSRHADDRSRSGSKRGVLFGTADYVAPEQTGTSGAVDGRADIYALGCTLFFLLTGRTVFPRETIAETLLAHREEAPPRPSSIRADVPSNLDRLFLAMTAKDPGQRIESMQRVLEELELTRAESDEDHDGGLRVLVDDRLATRVLEEPDEQAFQMLEISDGSAPVRCRSSVSMRKIWIVTLSCFAAAFSGVGLMVREKSQPERSERSAVQAGQAADPLPVRPDAKNEPSKPVARDEVLQASGLEFDGDFSEGVISNVGANGAKPLTVEIEVAAYGPASGGVLLSCSDDDAGWILEIRSGRWCLTLLEPGLPSTCLKAREQVRWHERQTIGVVLEESRAALYVDGLLESEWDTVPREPCALEQIRLGYRTGSEDRFAGRMHALRLSNGDRFTGQAAPDILAPADDSTLGRYVVERATGNELQDSSSHARHATLRKTAWIE